MYTNYSEIMSDTVKRIYSMILLMVFLLPSTGIMMYVHQCNMSNSILVDIEAQKPCCASAVASENTENDLLCSHSNQAKGMQPTTVSALPCCDDSQVYVKLGVHLLTQTIKVFNADFPLLLNSIAHQFSFTDFNPGNRIASNQYNYPPGEQTYIMFSSLRL